MRRRMSKRVVACMLAVVLMITTLATGAVRTIEVKADGNPVVEFAIEQGLDRALSLACYGLSYAMHAIDDSVDDEAYSQVVSFFDAFLWDTEVTWALQEIEDMCKEILEEVQTIEERQTEYGSAILGKLDNQEMQDAQRYLDSKIDEDINNQLKYNNIDTSQVTKAYVNYLAGANEYGDDVDKYADKKAAFDQALDNLLGSKPRTDEMRYVDGTIGNHLHNVLYNMTNSMCADADSATYLTDETVMDAAAQLAYMYYPWSQDQYEFVQFELNSQMQQIMLVELVYQEYLSRQYDYLRDNGYLDDTNNIGASCYESNKANLISDNELLAERFYDYTEKNLNVSSNVSLKLYQYYKPSDMTESYAYWRDFTNPNDTPYNMYQGSQIHGDLNNLNYRYDINYQDERDRYLEEDYHGGPLEGIDDDDFTSDALDGYYDEMGVNMYPVVRNGGVDIYCIDNNRSEITGFKDVNNLHKVERLVNANGATWGWGEQGFPSLTFYNRYHGALVMAPSQEALSIDYGSTSGYYNFYDQEHIHKLMCYNMARDISEIKPLLASDAFSAIYGGHLASYLGLNGSWYKQYKNDIAPDYLLFGKYSVSNNTAFGGTGKVTLHTLKTDATYDAATVDTRDTTLSSQDILHDGKDEDGHLLKNKSYAALYVPEELGTNMPTYTTAACFYDGEDEKLSYGEVAKVEISGDYSTKIDVHHNVRDDVTRTLNTAGDMITIKVLPFDDLIPNAVYLQASLYPTKPWDSYSETSYDNYWYELIKPGALSSLQPDEDGYYTIEVPAPYMYNAAFRIDLVKPDSSIVNETNPFNNEHCAYLKHSTDELCDILLSDKEKSLATRGADVRFALTGIKTEPFSDEMHKKFEIAAKGSGYRLSDNYVDFDITKRIKFKDAVNIKKLPNGEVTIGMQLPYKLKSDKDREYKLLRMHNGKIDVIDTTYDKATNELSFKTDRFSTYAIVYKDVDSTGASQSDKGRKSPKTGI